MAALNDPTVQRAVEHMTHHGDMRIAFHVHDRGIIVYLTGGPGPHHTHYESTDDRAYADPPASPNWAAYESDR